MLRITELELERRKDKEETAQWISAPSTIKAMPEASLAKVSTLKGQCCLLHHMTPYDGAFEKVLLWFPFRDVSRWPTSC